MTTWTLQTVTKTVGKGRNAKPVQAWRCFREHNGAYEASNWTTIREEACAWGQMLNQGHYVMSARVIRCDDPEVMRPNQQAA